MKIDMTTPNGGVARAPILFQISLGEDRTFVVTEQGASSGASFNDLSNAMRFAHEEAQKRHAKAQIKFDASLAMIRAAG